MACTVDTDGSRHRIVLVLLTALMQSLLAGFAEDHVVFGALHALDGLLILGIAAYLYYWSRRRES